MLYAYIVKLFKFMYAQGNNAFIDFDYVLATISFKNCTSDCWNLEEQTHAY